MASLNKSFILGNVGSPPELRHTGNGKPVANFTCATNEVFQNASGDKVEHTEWHKIVVWGKLAEHCNQYVKKGHLVFVEGRLRTREWTKDDVKRYTTEIHAVSVQFCTPKSVSEAPEQDDEPAPDDAFAADSTYDDVDH